MLTHSNPNTVPIANRAKHANVMPNLLFVCFCVMSNPQAHPVDHHDAEEREQI